MGVKFEGQLRRMFRFTGALFGLIAVSAGAFGAHTLERLNPRADVEVFETAVRYQMWHALALLVIASALPESKLVRASGSLFVAGTLMFSGSLYALALGAPSWVGPVTPLGGLALIGGWCLTCVAALQESNARA